MEQVYHIDLLLLIVVQLKIRDKLHDAKSSDIESKIANTWD